MPLPSQFAYDTETGETPEGIRTVLVQICSSSASKLEDVRLFIGEDSILEFLERFEETDWPMDCHCYNLKYEWSWLRPYILGSYEWVDTDHKRMKPGQFTILEDPMTVYQVRICNSHGKVMNITDDLRRVGSVPMEVAADSVKREHPDWWPPEQERTKEKTERIEQLYNRWWTLPRDSEDYSLFLHYAIVDAYSQAMITRHLEISGANRSLTSASAGLKMALHIRYGKEENPDGAWKERADFRKNYPPLSRIEQDVVESSGLGGFVEGRTGTYRGTFVHLDYSSSYPYEYAFGKMFKGKVSRLAHESSYWLRVIRNPNYFRWYLVSFDFDGLKPSGMPVINGKECATFDNPMTGSVNKKMRSGRVSQRLFTESYLKEINNHYYLYNITIHEVWFAARFTGDFRPFIEKCYTEKSRPELKHTMTRNEWKLYMNGGIHGKTITKTRRKKIIYPEGHRTTIDEVNDPELCALIGFTAMMNARERLVRDCRLLQREGHHVLMCDTDSIVVDTCEAEVRRILGPDKFVTPDGGMNNLGKFEFEAFEPHDTDGNPLKDHPRWGAVEFDEFRCWGLKRYCELDHGEYRKSAFAGMHEEFQEELLPDWETDGTEYEWEQNMSCQEDYGKVIRLRMKHAKAEDIWYREASIPNVVADPRPFDEYLAELERRLEEDYPDGL